MDIPTMDIPCFDLKFEPCDVDKENSCSTSRFPQLSESDIKSIEDGRLEASTKRATKWGVQIFKEWLKERQHDEMFEGLPEDQLDELLRQFYGEVRTKKGNQYGKSAMAGIRSAINRHLGGAPFNRNINIITDPKFRRSNNMFVGLIKQMKKKGLDKTKHHTAISDEDLKKLYSSDVFNNESPLSLLRKVWFNVTFYFGRRGSEGQRRLTKDSFTVGKDDPGREFVEMSVNEKEKNHPGTTSDGQHKQSRMYNIPDDEAAANCPVFAFKLYTEKPKPKSNTFFQRPLNTKPNDESSPWFMNAVIGEKKLQGMMKEISQLAELSCVYTNHCIRATTCTVLDKAGHKTHEIMAVTGHKSESSVRSYVNRLSSGQKMHLSDNLSAQCVTSQSQVYTPTSNILVLHHENTRPTDQRNVRPRTDEEPNVRPSTNSNTNLSMSFEEQSIALSSIFQGCNFRAPVNVTVNKSS